MYKSVLLVVSVLFSVLLLQTPSFAVDLGSFGDRIFSFQEKLAKSGNKLAQYKLGTLYEWGVSVDPDMNAATEWYQKSADQNYEPAINRLTFLEVKQHGYNEEKHGQWFDRVMKRVDENEPDALILLGQMNRAGIVVEKNLNLAVVLLQKASSLGHTEVDSQIDELKREIREAKAAQKAAEPEPKKAEPKPAPQPKVVKKAEPAPSTTDADKAAAEREAKRKRYEEAMRKLYQESQVLEQQQDWAESR